MSNTQKRTIHVVMQDHFIFDGQFDTAEEAEKYISHCKRNYVGHWERRTVTEEDFNKMLGSIDKPEYMSKVGQAIQMSR